MDYSPRTIKLARSLRRSPTEAEGKLWGYLRKERVGGHRFRRQVPVPPYIVDFMCLSNRLVIEVDGNTHSDSEELAYDAKRTVFLESHGFKVLRFWNSEIYNSIDSVIATILKTLQNPDELKDPHPPFGHLPPSWEG